MSAPWFQLAQVNVARAIAPLDDPRLADFIFRIAEVNAAAERAPGFVWRYVDDAEAPGLDDPRLLFNLSAWESPETLHAYVRGEDHMAVMRRRAEWFERPAAPSLALWWLPAGERPGAGEAMRRLEYLALHGPTEAAFTFAKRFPPPEAPGWEEVEGAVGYDGRRFSPERNSPNGDVNGETVFEYRQSGGRVWARYGGPGVLFGSLVAASGADGSLDMRYRHFSPEGELRAGICRSTPEVLADGRLRLRERWRWTTGDGSSGESVVVERR